MHSKRQKNSRANYDTPLNRICSNEALSLHEKALYLPKGLTLMCDKVMIHLII